MKEVTTQTTAIARMTAVNELISRTVLNMNEVLQAVEYNL